MDMSHSQFAGPDQAGPMLAKIELKLTVATAKLLRHNAENPWERRGLVSRRGLVR